VELEFLSAGDPLIPLGRDCLITKHLKLALIHFGPKFLCRCSKFEGLNVKLGFLSRTDHLISPGQG
jgi:hypothetical protein